MEKLILALTFLLLFTMCSHSQTKSEAEGKLIGSPCEGCESIFEYGNKKLQPTDTLPDFQNTGIKVKVTGTVYLPNGTTPAKDVILYIYHTDQSGEYATKGGETGWAKRHGYIRGWVKTDESGRYTFYTLKPGIYPNRTSPAHIHLTVLEPGGKYYWLESFYFEGDPLLTQQETIPDAPRGGTKGVVKLQKEGGLWIGTRDIVLGKNIPNYE